MSKAKPYVAKQPEKPSYKSVQGILLYLFLVPLFLAVILALFQTNIKAFLLNSISFFLFLAVATLAKKGFMQERIYHESIFTKAPKIPYKMVAGYLLGGATFFTSFVSGGQPLVKSAFLAIVAIVGYSLLYGFDPKKDKLENIGDISAEFVIKTIGEAKAKLSEVEIAMQNIKDTILHDKLQKALVQAEHILKTIQEDPKDVRVARKFLTVYIDGVAKVTKAYTELDEAEINEQTTQRLHTLMDEVEEKLSEELQRLKNNNAFDLDVHIDVLKEQIKG